MMPDEELDVEYIEGHAHTPIGFFEVEMSENVDEEWVEPKWASYNWILEREVEWVGVFIDAFKPS